MRLMMPQMPRPRSGLRRGATPANSRFEGGMRIADAARGSNLCHGRAPECAGPRHSSEYALVGNGVVATFIQGRRYCQLAWASPRGPAHRPWPCSSREAPSGAGRRPGSATSSRPPQGRRAETGDGRRCWRRGCPEISRPRLLACCGGVSGRGEWL